jgi:phosphatidylserine decarboxylase
MSDQVIPRSFRPGLPQVRGASPWNLLKENLVFLLTNRIPRRAATHFMRWFSRIEMPPLPWLSIAVWKAFSADLDLTEARATRFRSLNDCFTRELRPGARPVDPAPEALVSPCDGIVGAHGRVVEGTVYQAKGFPYTLDDLLMDDELVRRHRDGIYVTLRLTGGMYHRFHAPCDGSLRQVTYISGDTWNVHPIALRRIERLFCKNERAVLPLEGTPDGVAVTLVPVAAVLVASMRLNCIEPVLDLSYPGPNHISCAATFAKGDELGRFEQGSTIIVFAAGRVALARGLEVGTRVRMGQRLLEIDPGRS